MRTRRTNLIVTLVMVIAMLTSVGCKSSANVNETPVQTETKQEVTEESITSVETEEAASEVTDEVSDVTTEETVEEVESTPEPEVETYETAYDYAKTIDSMVPTLGIWNEVTKQGIVLENEEKYLIKEGDILVLATSMKEQRDIQSDIPCINRIKATARYIEYEFTEYPMEPTLLVFDPKIDGEEYELSITVVSEQAGEAAFLSEDGENEEEVVVTELGEDWANGLSFEEPKLLVWNDETGTKEVIDANGEYALKEGDKIATYTPDGYENDYIATPDYSKFIYSIEDSQVAKIAYKFPDESTTLILKHKMVNNEGGEIVVTYTIITP